MDFLSDGSGLHHHGSFDGIRGSSSLGRVPITAGKWQLRKEKKQTPEQENEKTKAMMRELFELKGGPNAVHNYNKWEQEHEKERKKDKALMKELQEIAKNSPQKKNTAPWLYPKILSDREDELNKHRETIDKHYSKSRAYMLEPP